MYLDTTTFENTRRCVAKCIGMEPDALSLKLTAIHQSPRKQDAVFIEQEFEKLLQLHPIIKPIDKVLMFHLSRRLKSSDPFCKNLQDLLVGPSAMSRFLQQFEISFRSESDRLHLIYQNQELNIPTSEHLACRFGMSDEPGDYCVNGFAFRSTIENSSYYMQLRNGPEFLIELCDFLTRPDILEAYQANSAYFCVPYLCSIKDVFFDIGSMRSSDRSRDFILQALKYLSLGDNPDNYENFVIASDDHCICDKPLLEKIELLQ